MKRYVFSFFFLLSFYSSCLFVMHCGVALQCGKVECRLSNLVPYTFRTTVNHYTRTAYLCSLNVMQIDGCRV